MAQIKGAYTRPPIWLITTKKYDPNCFWTPPPNKNLPFTVLSPQEFGHDHFLCYSLDSNLQTWKDSWHLLPHHWQFMAVAFTHSSQDLYSELHDGRGSNRSTSPRWTCWVGGRSIRYVAGDSPDSILNPIPTNVLASSRSAWTSLYLKIIEPELKSTSSNDLFHLTANESSCGDPNRTVYRVEFCGSMSIQRKTSIWVLIFSSPVKVANPSNVATWIRRKFIL